MVDRYEIAKALIPDEHDVLTTAEEPRRKSPIVKPIEDEMKTSFIDYAMSVIMARALPDVKDGLKPVHRRILYAMKEMGLTHDKPFRKSARIVGETLGKYHPHGDAAVYDTLVRMAQDFSMRYPLIEGQGNFGSIDGDAPAAMRYTEARTARITSELLEDLNKNTVDFMDNFDGTLKEPVVLPAKLPNLLINGASGIAVGMATNIPPHNLSEIIDGVITLLGNPEVEITELMQVIKGPDFPTGGIIYGIKGVVEAYSTGRGIIRVRAKTHMEQVGANKNAIIVTELPYQVNKANLLETIAELVRNKRIDGITDLRDESDREGLRVVIELRHDVNPDVVLNQLFANTAMETSFGIINLALVKSQPQILNLKELLQHYIAHRVVVVIRRTQFELDRAKEHAHILDGLIIALDKIDMTIRIIRASRTIRDAQENLILRLNLTERQAKAILDMRLQKLTSLETENLKKERIELRKRIERLTAILSDIKNVNSVIKQELVELKAKYGDTRRTEIVYEPEEVKIEDLIPEEDVIITITYRSYIKRLSIDSYRLQKRGGKGLIGMGVKEHDYIKDIFVASTHSYVLFFTNLGKVYWLKAHQIPSGTRYSSGKAIVNLLPGLAEGEYVQSAIPIKEFDDTHYLIFATKRGTIKKTNLSAYKHPRVTGIIAINLVEGDELIDTKLSDGTKEIILATKHGLAVRFAEREVRSMGRNAVGVRGIRLKANDEVIGMALVDESVELLTLTENGYGKRSPIGEYRITHRGSYGVITLKTSEKTGAVVSVNDVTEQDELLVTSEQGMVIRVAVAGIRETGRAAMGVRVMKLDEGDKLIAVAKLIS